MTQLESLPNEILVKIFGHAGPSAATTVRRVCKRFNDIVEDHNLGKHRANDILIKAIPESLLVTIKRLAEDGTLRQCTLECERDFLNNLLEFIVNRYVFTADNLILSCCEVDVNFLQSLSKLRLLCRTIEELHIRACLFHCETEEFASFLMTNKFSRLDCSNGDYRSVINNTTFQNDMPSKLIFLRAQTSLTDDFLYLLEKHRPTIFHMESDVVENITFSGLHRLLQSLANFPECSWTFGVLSTQSEEMFERFLNYLKEGGFVITTSNRGTIHYQAVNGRFTISFQTSGLRNILAPL